MMFLGLGRGGGGGGGGLVGDIKTSLPCHMSSLLVNSHAQSNL